MVLSLSKVVRVEKTSTFIMVINALTRILSIGDVALSDGLHIVDVPVTAGLCL